MREASKLAAQRMTELRWAAGLILAIWFGFVLDALLPLHYLGLVPRSPRGLFGIVFMPFLHGSFSHLMSNTFPLLVLLGLLIGLRQRLMVLVPQVSLLGGVLLWLFGRGGNHVGASLLVFGLSAYVLMGAYWQRRFAALLAAAVVIFLYGSTLLSGVLPFQPGISWEGHLLGAMAGVALAYRDRRA